MNSGLSVVATDLSREMVLHCKEKGIEAYEMDFYNLSSINKRFDCIYAINTLLHVPKSDLSKILHQVDSSLNTDDLFYMGLYGGDDAERGFIKSEVSDAPRFFALHSDNYLKPILNEYLDIISFDTLNV